MANTLLVESAEAQAWLGQFQLGDRPIAKDLLNALMLVSRDDFYTQLRDLVLEKAGEVAGPIALYTERELGHRYGVPHRLFKESAKRPVRAYGMAGPPAVRPTKAYDPSVGSEGLVAHLISELCKLHPKKFLNHPGPDKIRKQKVRAFWVVTDLVGTGKRAWNYLRAAWRVRSTRSWWSRGFLRFSVLAYASTTNGRNLVLGHASRPQLHHVTPCPTVTTSFRPKMAERVLELCRTYDPSSHDSSVPPWNRGANALGYGSTGALIVFAHGAPNNAPAILHRASRGSTAGWVPLFPSRVSATIDSRAFGIGLTQEKIRERLEAMQQGALAESRAIRQGPLASARMLLLLGALSRGSRSRDDVLCLRTGLTRPALRLLCRELSTFGWVDSTRRLTDLGHAQLRHARKQVVATRQADSVQPAEFSENDYYPSSLRHPVSEF